MQQILKRLELIKTAIALEDEEIIELQVLKLNDINIDEKVKDILTKLKNKDYGNVTLKIEEYLERFSGVIVYEDKELQGLRLELKVLEQKLQDISSEKNEYLNNIHEFNVQYHLYLGSIIKKILDLKETILFNSMREKEQSFEAIKNDYYNVKEKYKNLKQAKEHKEQELEDMDEFDDDYDELYEELHELQQELNEKEKELNEKRKEAKQAKEEFEQHETTREYQEAKEDSEEFYKENLEIENEDRFEITKEEKKELKKLYKKASKLCHPDIVSEELREQALIIFQQLNDANSKYDLTTVKSILVSLEHGNSFNIASDTIEDKDLLKSKITDIRDAIYQNEIELETIRDNEVIQIIEEYTDIEEYFDNLAEELESEADRLNIELNKET